MFKQLIKDLNRMNYKVTMLDGEYVVVDEKTDKPYLSFGIGRKDKEGLLTRLYLQLQKNQTI